MVSKCLSEKLLFEYILLACHYFVRLDQITSQSSCLQCSDAQYLQSIKIAKFPHDDGIRLVAAFCTLFRHCISLTNCGAHACTQYSRCGLM